MAVGVASLGGGGGGGGRGVGKVLPIDIGASIECCSEGGRGGDGRCGWIGIILFSGLITSELEVADAACETGDVVTRRATSSPSDVA